MANETAEGSNPETLFSLIRVRKKLTHYQSKSLKTYILIQLGYFYHQRKWTQQ